MKLLMFCFSGLILFFLSCNNSIPNEQETKQMKIGIISSAQISISWEDSLIFQHNNNWHSYLNIAAYDSLAELLKNSNILIKDMWTPNKEMSCKIPYTPGMEIIVKLSQPDSLIFKYGFQNKKNRFPLSCFEFWRHYKYTCD